MKKLWYPITIVFVFILFAPLFRNTSLDEYTVTACRKELEPVEEIVMNVSAYCQNSCCCYPYADGVTASGHVIQPGDRFVAAPPEFAFGTMLDIPGYGVAPVLDRGDSIKGRKLDVFFGDKDGVTGHQRALNWGRQVLRIRRLK